MEHFLPKVSQKVTHLGKEDKKGESKSGALFRKVSQKVTHFCKKGDESDAPVLGGFPRLVQAVRKVI